MGGRSSVRHGIGAVALIATTSALVACGGDAPPSEAVPALADRLERVDAAIADDRPDRARRAIEALVDEVTRARMDGRITADQADEIIRAAAELLDRLGTERDGEAPDPTDSPSPLPPMDEPDHEDADEPERGAEGHDGDEGNEPPEGNGPSDGHGN